MHVNPDLRVFLKWMIARSGSVITDVILLLKRGQIMTRLILATSLALLLGCNSSANRNTEADSGGTSYSATSPTHDDTRSEDWRLIDSNEWYDLFELNLTDTESIICSAFHKTDAQLGIGIALNVAILADDRGFRFFRFKETSLTDEQARMLEPLLPKDRVLETHSLAEFLNVEPEESHTHVFNAAFMTQLRQDQHNKLD